MTHKGRKVIRVPVTITSPLNGTWQSPRQRELNEGQLINEQSQSITDF